MSDENLTRRLRENDHTLDRVCVQGDIELHQACAAIQDNSNIRLFTISSGVVDLNVATAISTALKRMPNLEAFDIYFCDCSDLEATVMLASALVNKGSMRSLTWAFSNIGDVGAQAIASAFKRNTELWSLFLVSNNIGNDGAIAMASLIESNDSLTSVYLDGNNIGAAGARSLARAMTPNQTLTSLSISGNSHAFADAAEKAFKTALYNDESIESIISHSNHTITYLGPIDDGLHSLLDFNKDGPKRARRAKIIRFLNSKPRSLLSMNLHETVLPLVLDKVGRDCVLNTTFELVRNKPDLLNISGTQPRQQSRKRSRRS